jgi:hypothetical protein
LDYPFREFEGKGAFEIPQDSNWFYQVQISERLKGRKVCPFLSLEALLVSETLQRLLVEQPDLIERGLSNFSEDARRIL